MKNLQEWVSHAKKSAFFKFYAFVCFCSLTFRYLKIKKIFFSSIRFSSSHYFSKKAKTDFIGVPLRKTGKRINTEALRTQRFTENYVSA